MPITNDRTTRTRLLKKPRPGTLIQMGKLLKLSGLGDFCGIQEGDDLQEELLVKDKAALLLGILVQACDHLQGNPDFEALKKLGNSLLKRKLALS